MGKEKIMQKVSQPCLSSRRAGKNQKIKIILYLFLLLFVLFSSGLYAAAAVCTPSSGQVCVAVDDYADVYVNGVYVTTFSYVPTGGTIGCATLPAAAISALQATGNVIAVRAQNSQCCEMWATWSMQITCSNGGYSYVDSGDGTGISYITDTNTSCNGSGQSTDAGPSDGTYTWYQTNYNQAGDSTWAPASNILYLGQEWGEKQISMKTHNVLEPLGYGNGAPYASNGCQQIFFRQDFDLSVMPTPMPPNLTITKSAAQTTQLGGPAGWSGDITFYYNICNSGGGTTSSVSTADQWTDTAWQYSAPSTLTGIYSGGVYFGDVSVSSGTGYNDVFFEEGFPGVTCTGCTEPCMSFTYVLENYYLGASEICETWYNTVTMGASSSTVKLENFCPSPTSTPMPPHFTLQKIANNPNPISAESISFNLVICNTGGLITQAFTVYDDWSSSSPPDSWNFGGSYYYSDSEIETSSETGVANQNETIVFTPQGSGFDECFTFPLTLNMYSSPSNCSWHNNASLGYQGLPSVVATVNMADLCGTPSFTVTPTRSDTVTPTYTYTNTSTFTSTRTDTFTITVTYTPTRTPTPSPTETDTYTPTNTYSQTVTYTYTFTPTPSATKTDTMTITNTNTPSPSPTASPTYTNTLSPTGTYTNTVTYTSTFTPTPSATKTDTMTITDTNTPSPSPTASPTYTNTLSPTGTYTQTVTYTYTFTPTPSATKTDTMTITDTNTPSPTPTASPTYTNTLSPTSTFTQTVTYTSTFTPTPSNTITSTYTITMTYTEVIISATFTPTFTVTKTFTVTYTATPTNTNSPTQTVTLSPTSTYSNTVTYTSTFTVTPLNTATDTGTISPTSTVSPVDTLTITHTNTPTNTASPTPTSTYTFTGTPTLTNTIPNPPSYTNTPTWTPTFTDTPTFTITNTPTPTNTPSSTLTSTLTSTESSTFTDTPTPTLTYTVSPVDTLTDTMTQTPTYTNTPTYTFTGSPTLTYTQTSTFTGTPTLTNTLTDTNTVTLTSTYTNTPVNTVTDTFTFTPTLTFTYTFTLTYTDTPVNTWTDTPTITNTSTGTSTYTSTSTITFTSTASLTPTITITPVPFPYTMSIGVYNEAGELVRSITVTTTSSEPLGVGLYDSKGNSTNVIVPGTAGALNIAVPGIETPGSQNKNQTVSFQWDGTNDAGQDVANGVYYIQETTTDTFGHTEIITKPVTAINFSKYAQINIYNSAGELVDTIQVPYDGASQLSLNLSSSTGNDSVFLVGNGMQAMTITYTATGYVTWNGTDSQGNYLSSGVYEVQLVAKTAQGLQVIASKTVTILDEKTNDLLSGLKAYPNPYIGDGSTTPFTIAWQSGTAGTVKIKIYNIAGELVRTVSGDLNSGAMNWDLRATGGQQVSSGTYIFVAEAADTLGDRKTKIIKIAAIVTSPPQQ